MGWNQRFLMAFVMGMLPVGAQPGGRTALAVVVRPECGVNIVSQVAGPENAQTVTFNYKLRTSAGGGKGQILLRVSGAGAMEYRTTLTGPGVALSGAADGGNAGLVIAQFGPGAHTSRAGATGTVQIAGSVADGFRPVLSIGCE